MQTDFLICICVRDSERMSPLSRPRSQSRLPRAKPCRPSAGPEDDPASGFTMLASHMQHAVYYRPLSFHTRDGPVPLPNSYFSLSLPLSSIGFTSPRLTITPLAATSAAFRASPSSWACCWRKCDLISFARAIWRGLRGQYSGMCGREADRE